MLSWALGFFIVALVAAFFGFGGVAASAAGMAKVLFFAFLLLSIASLAIAMARGKLGEPD